MFGKKKKNEYEEEVVEEGRDEFDVDYNDDEDFETDFVSLDEDEDEKPKRGGIGKKVGITFGVILAVLVVAYVGMAFYFDSHFMFNTTINGNNFALKSVAQVEKYMEQQVADYTLTLQESDGDSEQITGSEISLEYVPGDEVKELAKKQNKFLWITSLWEKPVIEAKIGVKYDENALARRIESLNCLKEENQVASVDAHPEFQNTEFVVVPEVIGTQIDTETFNKDIRESIEGFQDTLNLTDTNCYIKPRFLSDSQEVVAAKDTMNSYLGANVTYDFNPNTEVVDVIVDADMNVTFNQEAVKEYIAALATKYNTKGKPRQFTTATGNTVTVEGGGYGWKINQDAEYDALIANIQNAETVTREPEYSSRAANHTAMDMGNTYAEVDLTTQHMWFIKDGQIALETDIVTGNPNKGNATPQGTYSLAYKSKNKTLRGTKKPDGTTSTRPTGTVPNRRYGSPRNAGTAGPGRRRPYASTRTPIRSSCGSTAPRWARRPARTARSYGKASRCGAEPTGCKPARTPARTKRPFTSGSGSPAGETKEPQTNKETRWNLRVRDTGCLLDAI